MYARNRVIRRGIFGVRVTCHVIRRGTFGVRVRVRVSCHVIRQGHEDVFRISAAVSRDECMHEIVLSDEVFLALGLVVVL